MLVSINEETQNIAMTVSSNMPGHLIRRLHQEATRVFLRRVREAGFDLTPVQFAALDALQHRPGIDQAGLAQVIDKDRANTGSVLDRLELKGYVARTVSEQDKRARVLSLTAKGEAVVAAVLPVVRQIQKEILPGLNEAEYKRFVALAGKAVNTTSVDH